MNSTVIVALISFAGTVFGTAGGILAAGKLTAYRLEQLENKLDRQSINVSKIPVMEEKLKGMSRRVSMLERNDRGMIRDIDGC